jgi:glycosyltransferase involved in cell wall biosynthesis
VDDAAAKKTVYENDAWGVQAKHLAWLEDFRARHGRAPRVLGIGNIANNGFRNAVTLRQYGVDCDVLVAGYYHIMGCPEWETTYFDPAALDDFRPIWSELDLGGYERPRWFAQGLYGTAVDYLISLREDGEHTEQLWAKLQREREGEDEPHSEIYRSPSSVAQVNRTARELALEFSMRFPLRKDPLTGQEILENAKFLLEDTKRLQRLFSHYDYVIGYSIDGMFPLLAGKREFVAYEHGTIRVIPFERTYQGRMCALTYAMAGDVLITNCDNILAATRLNLQSYRFVPHAMLEEWRYAEEPKALRQRLMETHDADFILFHPPRQHWSAARDESWDKANDLLIRAFARLVKEKRPKALLIMIEWGATVAESRALVDELGIAHRVVWLRTIPIRMLADYIAASDALADQFNAGAWGGILPLGLMLGTPVLIYLNEELHRWAYDQMPPVLNGRSVDAIYEGLSRLLDPDEAASLAQAGRAWYDAYHSMSVVAGRLIDSFIKTKAADTEFAIHPPHPSLMPFAHEVSASLAALLAPESSVQTVTVPLPRVEVEPGVEAPSAADRIRHAVVLRTYSPADLVCEEFWRSAGAQLRLYAHGAALATPAVPYHYAAAIPLDFSGVNFEKGSCWIAVELLNVQGELGVGLYDIDKDSITTEAIVDGALGLSRVYLEAPDDKVRLLMIRTGGSQGATAIFVRADVRCTVLETV